MLTEPCDARPGPAPRFRRCAGALLATLSLAAEGAHVGEDPFFEPLPLVLSASRLPQPQHEVPGAVTVIDRTLIEATGYRDLARIFRLVPGMQAGQERGHAHWVTYHGLSNDFPTEMQVLIDGRSVITPSAFGGVDWNALPITLDEIERIEVVRGTNANSFGANAFLGVINIITRHSASRPGAGGLVRLGEPNLSDVEGTWSGGDGPYSLRVSGAARRDSGFDDLHDDQRMDVLTLRSDWNPSPRDAVMLRVGASSGRRGEGYADSAFGNNAERDSRNDNASLHLQWRHTPAAGEEWLLSYYRNQERIRDAWLASAPEAGFPAVPLNRNRDAVRDDLELQHRSTPWTTAQLVWGVEARRDRVDAPFLFAGGNPSPQSLLRVFGNVEWRALDTLVLNLGAVEEKYSGARPRFSPRVFANWHAAPDHTLRAGYARAWRQRNLFELEGDIQATDPASGALLVHPYLPNEDLDQTRVDTVELGYFGRFPDWDTTLDVRVFNERIRDFTVRVPQADPSPPPLLSAALGSARYENLDRAVTLQGIEYQLVTRPLDGTELRLTHSLINRRSGDRSIDDRSAPYTASLSWLQDYGGGWRSMVSLLRMGPLSGADGYVPRHPYVARSYTTVDASLGYHTRLGGRPAKIALTALNLGPRHQEIADRSEQARFGRRPANPVTPSVYLTFAIALD